MTCYTILVFRDTCCVCWMWNFTQTSYMLVIYLLIVWLLRWGNANKHLINKQKNKKLDYCNSVKFRISGELRDKLQPAQNAAAQIISCLKITDHVAPTLHNLPALHYLPIRSWITNKLALITYVLARNWPTIFNRTTRC